MWGSHCIRSWSKTQTVIAQSSAESELTAAVKTTSEALGLIAMARDMGYRVEGQVWIDASATMGIINRRGVGKVRHLDTQLLWVQQKSLRGEMEFGKVWGKENPADLMTKGLDEATAGRHLDKLKLEFKTGRADKSAKLT